MGEADEVSVEVVDVGASDAAAAALPRIAAAAAAAAAAAVEAAVEKVECLVGEGDEAVATAPARRGGGGRFGLW